MTPNDWNAGTLLALSGDYWQTFTLHAAVKLNLFTHLGLGALTASDIADSIGADLRGATMLLHALTGI